MKLDFDYKIDFAELKEIENKHFKIDRETVLFVVDMNNGFAKCGALYSDRVEAIIPDVKRIMGKFLDIGNPVIAFTDSHSKDAIEFKDYPEHCLNDSIESELVEELKEFEFNIKLIRKNSTNGFLEEKTQQIIKELISKGYKKWVIIGCCTDICVKFFATTLKCFFNANNLDLDVIVPIKAVETYDAPGHNASAMNLFSLLDMKLNGIKLVDDIE